MVQSFIEREYQSLQPQQPEQLDEEESPLANEEEPSADKSEEERLVCIEDYDDDDDDDDGDSSFSFWTLLAGMLIGAIVASVTMLAYLVYAGRKKQKAKANYNEPYSFDVWVNP